MVRQTILWQLEEHSFSVLIAKAELLTCGEVKTEIRPKISSLETASTRLHNQISCLKKKFKLSYRISMAMFLHKVYVSASHAGVMRNKKRVSFYT